jgi:hypothetical protein
MSCGRNDLSGRQPEVALEVHGPACGIGMDDDHTVDIQHHRLDRHA